MVLLRTYICPHVIIPYPLRKLTLTSSFSYWWIWHISVLMSCEVLSADYVRVHLVYLFSFFVRLHAVEIFFRTIFLCLPFISFTVSFCLHAGFDYLSSCLHVGIYFFLVWPNIKQNFQQHVHSTHFVTNVKFDTGVDFILHSTLGYSFWYTKLIGCINDEGSLQEYSNDIIWKLIKEQFIYILKIKSRFYF